MTMILGIHDGHDASAALMVDGRIVAAAQEERFSGLKGDYGYPMHAVDFCLRFAGVAASDLDYVALSARSKNPVLNRIKRNALFSVTDWVREQEDFWKPLKFKGVRPRYYDLFKDCRPELHDTYYDYSGLLTGYMNGGEIEAFLERRIDFITGHLGIDRRRLHVMDHETDHKCYALFGSQFRERPVLILTVEGIGEAYNATVSVYRDGVIETLRNLKECHLGHLYQYTALILGMKPNQHEYKVMGLAPYANEYEMRKAYRVYRKILKVDGLSVRFDQKPADLYYTIRDELKDCRFDGIAAGMQKFLEEVLCEWTANCVAATGIREVVYSGGVAQNIKAMQAVSQLDCIDDIFVPPAAGDTSKSIGACYQLLYELSERSYESHLQIEPLKHVYLGPEYSRSEIMRAVREQADQGDDLRVTCDATNARIADLLARGKVLGLVRGRMEFGLRALGNRTILADPSNPLTIDRINQKIKFRDFWMPFTPSLLDYREADYIVNPKRLCASFMTMTFDSVEANRADFPAAMHPADKTVRPHVVTEDVNSAYYGLLQEFEKRTGRGILLNTSFNLHGSPVVLGPREALFTLMNSGLDGLVLEDVLVQRATAGAGESEQTPRESAVGSMP